MKILIATDSFKGSLSSLEAGNAIADGIRRAGMPAEIQVSPIADGGEGTTEALVNGLSGYLETVTVSDPLGRKQTANYGILPSGTAVMEMAAAAGLPLLSESEYPHTATIQVTGVSFFYKGLNDFWSRLIQDDTLTDCAAYCVSY